VADAIARFLAGGCGGGGGGREGEGANDGGSGSDSENGGGDAGPAGEATDAAGAAVALVASTAPASLGPVYASPSPAELGALAPSELAALGGFACGVAGLARAEWRGPLDARGLAASFAASADGDGGGLEDAVRFDAQRRLAVASSVFAASPAAAGSAAAAGVAAGSAPSPLLAPFTLVWENLRPRAGEKVGAWLTGQIARAPQGAEFLSYSKASGEIHFSVERPDTF